jgi:hypothetical protein
MTISQLIEWLEQQRARFGDLEVLIEGDGIEDKLVCEMTRGVKVVFLSTMPAE